jgi:predicted DNA binding protein
MVPDRKSPSRSAGGPTDEQKKLLREAVKKGYFKVPRQVSLSELAASRGISDREASKSLRRGVDALVREEIVER